MLHTTVLSVAVGSIILVVGFTLGVQWYFQPKRYYRRLAQRSLKSILKSPNVKEQITLLRDCHYLEFEELVMLAFSRCRNVRRSRTTSYTRDGGFDGFATIKVHNKYCRAGIQSKRYSGYINRKDLCNLRYACSKFKLIPIFVYTGVASKGNLEYARNVGIHMINENALVRVLMRRTVELEG